jgi:hypothetical protein
MAYDDTLIVDHLEKTHHTNLLSRREKHLVGLAVTMTHGCQVCTRNRGNVAPLWQPQNALNVMRKAYGNEGMKVFDE